MPVPKNVVEEEERNEEDGGIKLPKWAKTNDIKPIVSELIEIYPEELSHIRPSRIGYVAFSRKKSKKQAFVAPIKPMVGLFADIDYILAIHIENWVVLDASEKYLLVFHELLHIPAGGFDESSKEYRKTLDHDIKDFSLILHKFGIEWEDADKILKAKAKHKKESDSSEDSSDENDSEPEDSNE